MTELADLCAAAAAAAIRRGELSSEALVAACLERIAAREPRLHAFVDLQPARAIADARAIDATAAAGESSRPLCGVPVAVKEVFDVTGYRCTWGTPVHGARVAQADAVAVERLRHAGAVILGTTVSTEYAIARAGPTTHPLDPARTPGGSSSGSAAAVAAGMVPLALGSQSIGSVIRPATYCGVLGLKPSFGAIPTRGGMPLAGELDHVGILARHPEDIALACAALFGRDARDPLSRRVAPPGEPPWTRPLRVLRIDGPLRERVGAASAAAVTRTWRALAEAGLEADSVTLEEAYESVEEVVFTLLCRGIARHHGADHDAHAEAMSARLRELVRRGRAVGDAAHARAVAAAAQFRERLAALLPPGTVGVTAAVDDVAPPREQGTGSPLLQGLWTLAGLPALAVPAGTAAEGLPIGAQLVAGPGQEGALLHAARLLLGSV